jgi:hypothetical protein
VTAWEHIDLDASLAVLEGWAGRRVIVSVDLAAGPPGLAGMTGVLRPAAADGQALSLELEDSEAWLRLPAGPSFVGASYDPVARVLVLEFSPEGPSAPSAVLVDIQLLRSRIPAGRQPPPGSDSRRILRATDTH